MANQEHLEIIKQGVGVWNEWRGENRDTEIDFTGATLTGVDLTWAYAGGTSFGSIDLSQAKGLTQFATIHLPHKADVLTQVVGDLRGWNRSAAKYDAAFRKLLKALKAD